jgi:sarcosine oxidase
MTAPAPARPCPGTPTCVTDVVVIGGGALGAATAWWLARTGRSVVLLEERSARELRLAARGTAWSAHPSWTPPGQASLLAEAEWAWRELERETGAAVLTRADAVDHGTADALAGLAGHRLDPDAAQARWPGTAFAGPVLLRPGAASQVRADHAVAALTAAAVGHGAVVRYRSPVLAVDVIDGGPGAGGRVEVRTATGRIRARRAVVTGVDPAGRRGVELHVAPRPGAGLPGPLVAHHDPVLGLVRAVPCAQGHLAVGAASWPRGTVPVDLGGDLRDHVRTWFPGLDHVRPEPVEPAAMSTASGEVTVTGSGPVRTATCSALGSVAIVAVARRLADASHPAADDRRRRRVS